VNAWTDAAACRTEDPDLFHPDGSAGLRVIEEAKAVCRRCPVADACLQDALDSGQGGIRGGLTEAERASLQRAIARRGLSEDAVAAQVAQARNGRPASRPRTVREYADRYAVRVFGGHLDWDGPRWPQIDGKPYTPAQILFAADRGRHPEGRVVANCGYNGCIKPSHVTDDAERRTPATALAA